MLPYTGETIPHTDLPPAAPDSPNAAEWETYRREVARLLAEGREGQFVLVRGETVVGFWPTEDLALDEGYRRFYPLPFLVHQVRSREPLLRSPVWFHLWHASRSPSRRTA